MTQIIAAAIRFPARPDPAKPEVQDLILFVPRPGRHHNVLGSMFHRFADGKTDRTSGSYMGEVQGFLTEDGEFVDRKTAYILASNSRQIKRPLKGGYQGDELFSEDLW